MPKEDVKNLPVISKEELKTCDGQDGRKAYIALKDKVYDVSDSLWWDSGEHQGAHKAGRDMTDELNSAPHSDEVLENIKVVALLKKD